jgi:hypothetical protein
MIRSLTILALLLGASVFTPARAEVNECTNITSLPAVITTQGVYCLKQNLETNISSGAAITINTNNVTIDCNDWKIGGLQAGINTMAVGIHATGRLNTTIRNCGVRGFMIGIQYVLGAGSAGHLIEDNRVDLNTVSGIEARGDGLVLRRNRVVDTGGRPDTAVARGILVNGSGAMVRDNTVSGVSVAGVAGNGSVTGFDIFSSRHEFSRNLVVDLIPIGTGVARGFWDDSANAFRANTIINAAATSGNGITGNASSFCQDNLIRNYSVAISACTDAGGNFSN